MPAIEAMLMILPERLWAICRAAACMQKKTPLALIAWIQSQSASLTSKKSSLRVTPALFSRMSRRPKRSTVRATSASMSFRFRPEAAWPSSDLSA